MKRTGAFLARYALEQLGIRFTFGIPGVHNTELYDELNKSKQIEPILVTHEGAAAFMADAVSRTSNNVGVLAIVPAAGTSHAMSGIGEAFLDGIPLLVISGGVRTDTGKSYQLHQIDQEKLVGGVVKKFYRIKEHKEIIDTIFDAYTLAISGEPGPAFVELPVNLQMFQGEVHELKEYRHTKAEYTLDMDQISQAVDLLLAAKNPGLYVGWGCAHATESLIVIAEKLGMPVSTTLQGKSVFPADHPLHTGVGFGASSVPAAENSFKDCDCLLAIGVRFAELATGSYGVSVPENLIHIDINPEVFDKNYVATIKIQSDSEVAVKAILEKMKNMTGHISRDSLKSKIKEQKENYFSEWEGKKNNDRVSPGHFFNALRKSVPHDAMMVVDDGKHTFLASELFPIYHSGHFISPTDFNCMGYCVPASIGVQLANRDKTVIAIVGDGAFLMTGLELTTARTYDAHVIVFVFHDGELGQISQFQKIPLNRKTCSIIGDINIEGIAQATGVGFVSIQNDNEIDNKMSDALSLLEEGPVLVDVNIDYSKKTRLTKGVVKTNLGRFPLKEKIRFISRAAKRHITG